MINALLIDREWPVINHLTDQLARICPEIKVNGKADSLLLADQLIAQLHPQIVFIDIAWPDDQGVTFLRQFQPGAFETIIITNDQLYALQALRCCAAGYILKPVQNEELLLAVKTAYQRIQEKQELASKREQVRNMLNQINEEKIIGVPTIEGYELMRVGDIIRCEGLQRCTRIVTTAKKDVISAYSIGEFKKLLAAFPSFFSPHRSHLVNIRYVDKLKNAGEIFLKDGSRVPVTKAKKNEFLDLILVLR